MSGSLTRGRTLQGERTLDADVVICGGGAGGCMAARELARAGLDVVLLEAGDDQLPHTFTQREDEMIPRMFARAGGQRTEDRSMMVLSGHGLGGATNHNINLCKRAPAPILEQWQAEHGAGEGVARFFEMVERDLGVRAFDAIGAEGLSRVDFFLTEDGFVVNEINTMPGFTPISMFPRCWQESGLSYPDLIDELIQVALARA